MAEVSAAPVLVAHDGAVATITLNRPDVGNAIDPALIAALGHAVEAAAGNPAVRCVVLTGAGKLFCGGGDIGVFRAQRDEGAAGAAEGPLRQLASDMHAVVLRLAHMPKPLVTLVNGPAAGAGMSFAIAGDIVLAAHSAHFTAAYGAIGLTPDGGMSWFLPRLVGLRRATEIILSNRRIATDEAERIGLITRAVPDDALRAEGMALAQALAAGPTQALGGARQLLLTSLDSPLARQLDREAVRIAEAGIGAELAEGIAAFFAKRRPDFSL